jgi:orotidine-5'-phosphate decarboxylase
MIKDAFKDPRIIVALDFPTPKEALALAQTLDPTLCRVKVGKELFTTGGPQLVESLMAQGFQVFLDLKFHDIPSTVSKACEAAARLGVWMVNVHASGGVAMMKEAKEGIERSGKKTLLIGVTVLTSMNEQTLHTLGIHGSLEDHVLRLATLTHDAGLDGVVCSAQETRSLRERFGGHFCLVTPGIRPSTASHDDQQRVVTPSDAIRNGSSYLVIGRPITQAPSPLHALSEIQREISGN